MDAVYVAGFEHKYDKYKKIYEIGMLTCNVYKTA